MSKLIIPTENFFEEKAKNFTQTALGEKLQKKYTPKPFEEKWRVLYWFAWLGSFFCSMVAIITGSTFVFAYALGLVAKIPYPHVIAGMIASFVLGGLEVLKQTTVPPLFQDTNQYSFKKVYVWRVLFIFVLYMVSFLFNYYGGFDFIETITNPPIYAEPKQKNLEKTRKEYKALIHQALENAEQYKASKTWKGKLSDENGKVYATLLEKKEYLTEKMIAKIDSMEHWNDTQRKEAITKHENATKEHKSNIHKKGKGLGTIKR